MGATILRWFWRDGVRHRAYFRSVDGDVGRELVVAAGTRSYAIPAPDGLALDELPEALLHGLAETLPAEVVPAL